MKIACISASQVPSDSANSIQVMKVGQAFAQLGNDLTLLVPGVAPAGVDLLGHYGLQKDFPRLWLPTRGRRIFPWKAIQRARALHTNLVYAWPVQVAALGLLAGLPAMLEMHDYPTGRFGPLWYRVFLNLPGKKRLLPITDALRRALERRFGPPRSGDTLIAPDGVDLERYEALPEAEAARRLLGLPDGLTVGCTGHLYAGRGADLFLELAAAFPRVNFLWVGGRQEEVEVWRRRTLAAHLTNATFTGFVPNMRLPLYQAAADVLLMPYGRAVTTSSGGNTAEICSPMKMFEYMAAGRPSLTSDLPVLREVLDETCAAFCPPEDTLAWKSALRGLLTDQERRQSLARSALKRVAKYSWIERARRSLQGFEV